MTILSSYPLPGSENSRIASLIEQQGGTFYPTSHSDERDSIIARIDRYISDATIFLGGRLTQEQLDRAENLEWIHVPWAGVNNMTALDFSKRQDVVVSNSRGVMADSVADQTMAYLLMLNRNLAPQVLWQAKKKWHRYQTVEHSDRKILRGMTLGIVGFGAIGEQIAIRSRAFGMKVIGVKTNPSIGAQHLDEVFGLDQRDEVLRQSDFVVIALPLTETTKKSVGEREFEQMKQSAYLINISRGAIVNTEELVKALRSNSIAGAALDVVDPEPLPEDSELWGMESVIVTPHSSGGFVGFGTKVAGLFLENLSRYSAGKHLLHRVDLERGY